VVSERKKNRNKDWGRGGESMTCPLLRCCPEKVDYNKYKRVCKLNPNKCEIWKNFIEKEKLLPREWEELMGG